jgi:hypothetical protein
VGDFIQGNPIVNHNPPSFQKCSDPPDSSEDEIVWGDPIVEHTPLSDQNSSEVEVVWGSVIEHTPSSVTSDGHSHSSNPPHHNVSSLHLVSNVDDDTRLKADLYPQSPSVCTFQNFSDV